MSWLDKHRPAYSYSALRRLIDPQSVAVVGLSRNDQSFGARTAKNLSFFEGRRFGVNPKADELYGIPCFSSIAALPEVVDCAVLAVPVDAVEALVEECAAAGVGGCIIYASGFAETARPDRVALQQRLTAIARSSQLRIVGPNCIGLINNVSKAGLSFSSSYAVRLPRTGAIGIASQSGGLGQAIAQVAERGGAYSHYMAAGNSCDVDVCDYVSYLAGDPSCKVIACIAEGLSDGERLIEAGEAARAADKPIVMYKLATGGAAAKAAMSHTGTLAGSNAAFEAAYRRLGIVNVNNLEDIYETASFLAKAGTPKAPGVAVVAASGGACVISLDKAEEFGVQMPAPQPATQMVLDANVPDFGAAANPCDITAQVATNPASYRACAEAMLADPGYSALIVMAPSINPALTPRNIDMFSSLAAAAGKPVCMSWISEWKDGPGAQQCEADPHVARFQSTAGAFRVLAAWHKRAAIVRGPEPRTRLAPAGSGAFNPAAERARALLAAAGQNLTEREAKEILAAYGVPVVADRVVQSQDEAVSAAEQAGFPVVLKVESPDIPHKTEAGVVRLNLGDAGAVRRAYAEIMAAAGRVQPAPAIAGVLVQPMIGAGVEMVVGSTLDPTFGPMVVVGMGGILVELLRDSTAELAPVNLRQAHEMLARLKSRTLLTGYRGSEPVQIDRLAEIIVSVSELAADLAGTIAEIDINPIICSPGRTIAVDGLIIRHLTAAASH
jgi:acyl-CoA synthetase (NDP forming)